MLVYVEYFYKVDSSFIFDNVFQKYLEGKIDEKDISFFVLDVNQNIIFEKNMDTIGRDNICIGEALISIDINLFDACSLNAIKHGKLIQEISFEDISYGFSYNDYGINLSDDFTAVYFYKKDFTKLNVENMKSYEEVIIETIKIFLNELHFTFVSIELDLPIISNDSKVIRWRVNGLEKTKDVFNGIGLERKLPS